MARILLIAPSLAAAGGMDRMVAAISRLLNQSHEVHVCSFDGPGARPHFDPEAPFHALREPRRLPLPLRWITYLEQVRQVRQLKDRLEIDLTISNLWRADLVSVLSGGRDRKVSIAHANVAGSPVNRLMVQARWLVARIYRRFDRIVAVAGPLAHGLRELYRLEGDRLVTIHNFLERPPDPSAASRGPSRTLFWCGRLIHEKNPMPLVPIFEGLYARDASLRLVVIGDGPQREQMIEAAGRAGLTGGEDPPIRWTGIVENPREQFRNGAVLLLTSYSEGLPLVVLEAFSEGLAVAAADCAGGGVHEALRAVTPHDPERTLPELTPCGLLLPVPVGGSDAVNLWVEHLGELLRDEQKLRSLRCGAHARAGDFTEALASRKWHTLIDEVLA